MVIEYEINGQEVPFNVFRDHVRSMILEEVGNSIDDDDAEGLEILVRDEIRAYELQWEKDNEDRYLLTLPDNYFSQYVVTSDGMDVFRCSIDFARVDDGRVVDFDELKSVGFEDFINLASKEEDEIIPYIRKKYKNYYYQIQEQLYCTALNAANLVFLCVYGYDDEENAIREIQEGDFIRVRVHRDEEAIEKIKERGMIFQQIKDYYANN